MTDKRKMLSVKLTNRIIRLIKNYATVFESQGKTVALAIDILDLIVRTMESEELDIHRTSVILYTMKSLNGKCDHIYSSVVGENNDGATMV